MTTCKRCHAENIVKNGMVREKPRYRCKACGYNFVVGDARINESLAVKKALAVILYSLGKASFGMLGKIFGVPRALTYLYIAQEADKLPEPSVSGSIRERAFNEMWHFVGSKNKQWIIKALDRGAQDNWVPGLSAVVILEPSGSFMTRLGI